MDKRITLFSEIPTLESDRLVIRPLTQADADGLQEMVSSESVYRYLPTFLFEKKYDDVHEVISRLYTECLQESMILGVFVKAPSPGAAEDSSGGPPVKQEFCGLAEMYGYREQIHKVSIGYRSRECFWGQDIATEVIAMLVDYLHRATDIEIITASTMLPNKGSARALEKNGFSLVSSGFGEDWGYPEPTPADKWIL